MKKIFLLLLWLTLLPLAGWGQNLYFRVGNSTTSVQSTDYTGGNISVSFRYGQSATNNSAVTGQYSRTFTVTYSATDPQVNNGSTVNVTISNNNTAASATFTNAGYYKAVYHYRNSYYGQFSDHTQVFQVKPKELTVTAQPVSKVYGTDDADVTFPAPVITGVIAGQQTPTITDLTAYRDGTDGTEAGEDVKASGGYAYKFKGGSVSNTNYTIGTYAAGTLTIIKKDISFSPMNLSKPSTVSDADFAASEAFTFNVDGIIGTYDSKDVASGVTISRSNVGNSVGATYQYSLGTDNATLLAPYSTNYNLTGATGTAQLSIVAESDIIVTLGTLSKTYGDADPALALSNVSINLGTNASYTKDQILASLSYTRGQGDNVGIYSYAATSNIAAVTVSNQGAFIITPKDISDASIAIAIADQDFTGSALTPAITVTDAAATITENDWTVAYTDNVGPSVGTAKATITGKGNYTGTNSANFDILLDLSNTAMILSGDNYVYSGSAFEPSVATVTIGETIVDPSLYTVAWSDNINATTDNAKAKATISAAAGAAGVSGTQTQTFNILQKSLAAEEEGITVEGVEDKTYTRGELTQTPTVKFGNIILVADTDYELSYTGNTNVSYDDENAVIAGAKVTITGKGNYKDSREIAFTVLPKSLADNDVTYSAVTNPTYNKTAQNPGDLTVTYAAVALTDADFTIAAADGFDNINAGDAKVTLTGKGNFTGTKDIAYSIVAKNVTVTAKAVTLGYGASFVDNGAEGLESYTLIEGDVLEGTAKLTVVDYGTSTEATFPYAVTAASPNYQIQPSGLSNANYNITFEPANLTITAGQVTATISGTATYGSLPTFTLEATSGLSPDETTAFNNSQPTTVTVKNATAAFATGVAPDADALKSLDAGTYTLEATVTLANYDVLVSAGTLTVNPNASATFTIADIAAVDYNGTKQEPTGIEVKEGTKTLVLDTDYTVAYGDDTHGNIDAGEGIVKISGAGNYAGSSAEKTFTINKVALTITAGNDTWTYGTTEPTYTYTAKLTADDTPVEITNGELAGVDGTLNVKRTSNETVGTHTGALVAYFGTAQPTSSTNYAPITWEAGDLQIVAGDPIVIKLKDVEGTYGETAVTNIQAKMNDIANYELVTGSGNVTENNFADVIDVASVAIIDASNIGTNAGSYKFTVDGATSTNYGVKIQEANYIVNPAAITIAALDQTINWSDNDDTNDAANEDVETAVQITSTAGLRYSDEITDLIAKVNISGTNVGTNVISLTKTDNANYDIELVDGTLTVIGADALELAYNANNLLSTIQSYADGKSRDVTIKFGELKVKNDGNEVASFGIGAEKWQIVVLPFATTPRKISKAFGYAIVNLVDVDKTTDGNVMFKLVMSGDIPANTPFLVKNDVAVTSVTFEDVKIEAPADAKPYADAGMGYKLVGCYEVATLDGVMGSKAKWLANGGWNYINDGSATYTAEIMPFNGYVDLTAAGSGARGVTFTMEEADGTTTAIRSVDIESNSKFNAEGLYNLNGMKMDGTSLKKGVYIQNGKKVVIK